MEFDHQHDDTTAFAAVFEAVAGILAIIALGLVVTLIAFAS